MGGDGPVAQSSDPDPGTEKKKKETKTMEVCMGLLAWKVVWVFWPTLN